MLSATKFTLNTTIVALTDFFIKIINFVFILFIARNLSISNFGLYSFILSFFYLFLVTSNFGIEYSVARSVSNNDNSILKNSFATRFYMSLFSFILCLIIGILIGLPKSTMILVSLYSLSIFCLAISESILPIFRGKEFFIYERMIILLKNVLFIVLAVPAIYITKSLLFLIFAYLIAESVGALTSIYLLKKISKELSIHFKLKFLNINNFSVDLLKNSLPLITGVGLMIFYYKIDSIILKLLKGNYDTGIYSSAFRIYEALLFIPVAIHTTILPRLIKIEKENLDSAIDKIIKITLLIASIISILIIYYSRFIPLLYGRDGYQALVGPLKIIFFIVPIAFINYICIAIAYVKKREIKVLFPLFFTTLFNIAANFYFIPRYSYFAAAWITSLSEIFLFVFINYYVLNADSRKLVLIIKFYIAFLLSLSLMYINYSIVLALPAIFINLLMLYILKVFNNDDIVISRKILREIFDLRNKIGQ